MDGEVEREREAERRLLHVMAHPIGSLYSMDGNEVVVSCDMSDTCGIIYIFLLWCIYIYIFPNPGIIPRERSNFGRS
jgi:hypothetical protein